MKKSKVIAIATATALTFSSTASFGIVPPVGPAPVYRSNPIVSWSIFGCAGGIVAAALAANYVQNRPLTWNEAATCGALFWFTPPKHR
jgi:hypothetical protein